MQQMTYNTTDEKNFLQQRQYICHQRWHSLLTVLWDSTWPTQPSIPPGSVNEYQLRLGRQRQVWFIPLVDVRRVCR